MRIKRTDLLQSSIPYVYQVKTDISSLENIDFSIDTFPVTLKADQAGSDINIKGFFSVILNEVCDRCLSPFNHTIKANFQLILTEKESLVSGNQDNDIFLFPAHQTEFDLGPTIRDAILLERTLKQICSKNCKGLCSHCGINLNKNECLAEKDVIDERWTPLKKLKLS